MQPEHVCILFPLVFVILAYIGVPFFVWTAYAAVALWYFAAPVPAWIVFGVVAIIFNLPPLRRLFFSGFVFMAMNKLKLMPKISETEAIALKAGDVWIERELFSGKPNFKTILEQSYPSLTTEEQSFIDNQVEKLCEMVDDFKLWKTRKIPGEVMNYMKKEKFFGMIVPKEYGGLAFSALAHSAVVQKLSSRSMPITVTAMVPNSLGPAELLAHFGTEEQKKTLLPKLATGEEFPCFALTEPGAGSDAASVQATGVVFKDTTGKLSLKLNWNKRWITLASHSTLIGLAFRLYDPENYLGKGKDVGITCALIPSKTPGVTATHRHDPLYIPFVNSPTQGKDVIVPIDVIIGGPERAGQGWSMLMESLGAGRGISLPGQSTGSVKMMMRVASAHSTVRKQFGMSIGRFEGVADALSQIGGYTYLLEAARTYTLGALDSGKKPPVVTALMKYYTTEISRKCINHAMDIVAGAAIVVGPRNLLAHLYISAPISITVEGANILTRTLMVFGQGALRAHPYAYLEVDALDRNDRKQFDSAFCGHLGHIFRNLVRTIVLFFTRGLVVIPARSGVTTRYYQKLSWVSAAYAFFADFLMGSLGGGLKAKGILSGRMADVLAWMYLATSCLRRFEAEGRKKEDELFLKWSMQTAFHEIHKAFDGLLASVDTPVLKYFFNYPLRWLHALNPMGCAPSDETGLKIARAIQKPGELRDRLTNGIFIPKKEGEALYDLENAFRLVKQCESLDIRVKKAVREKVLTKKPQAELLKDALAKQILTQEEYENLSKVEKVRDHVIQVDSFSEQEYVAR